MTEENFDFAAGCPYGAVPCNPCLMCRQEEQYYFSQNESNLEHQDEEESEHSEAIEIIEEKEEEEEEEIDFSLGCPYGAIPCNPCSMCLQESKF